MTKIYITVLGELDFVPTELALVRDNKLVKREFVFSAHFCSYFGKRFN